MPIDDRTSRLNLPLPNQDNFLEDDVQRLRDALSELDAKVATVDAGGKVPADQLPAIAITDTFPVNSEAEMLALDAQPGDVAIRNDVSKSFILMEAPATVSDNWKELIGDAVVHLTPQIRESLRRTYADAGFNLVAGSFDKGGTVTTSADVLLYEVDGKAYSWGGSLPYSVPAGSTPSNSGGVSAGGWKDRSSTLRKIQLESVFVYDKDYSTIAEAFSRATTTGAALVLTASSTIRIPTDAPSLQAVINTCSRLRPSVYLTVILDAGFKFAEETLVEKRDCSWITIQSVDSVVTASPSFSGVNLLHVVNSFGPIWDILVDVAGSTVGNGLYVRRNSDIEVRPGKGVINAKNTAITAHPCGIVIVESSRGHIPSSNFSGNYRNLWVSKSSQCNAEGGNFDNATGDFATYIVRNSLCHLSLATVNNAAHNAVYANNSRITFLEGEATNADTALNAEFGGVIYTRPRDGKITNISGSRINAISSAYGSIVIADGMTIAPAAGAGISAHDGGKVIAIGTSVSAPGSALLAYNEGEINIIGPGNAINTTNPGVNAVRSYQGGRINLDGATVTGGSVGLLAESGGVIHARAAQVSGQGSNTIQATGGEVYADNAVLSKTSVNADVVYARRGGVINANFATITGGRIGAHADAGGKVSVNNATINGASIGGVRATGGEAYAQSATVQNNTGKDLAVLSGGILRAGGATTTNSSPAGTPNPSDANVAFNTFGAPGFIFA